MKKALIFLLSLAVVGAVFAQDAPTLTFGGHVQTGIVYQMGENYDPAVAFGYNNDGGNDAYRFRLDGTGTAGDAGAKFRIESTAAGAPSIAFAWVYSNLFDSMAKVDLGYKIDDNTWRTKGKGEFDYNEDYAVQFQVKPIEGLNFGGTIGVPTKGPVAAKAAIGTQAAVAGSAGVELNDLAYIAGMAYSMAPFGVQAGLRMAAGEMQGVYGGFDYTDLVPGLTLVLEAQMGLITALDDDTTAFLKAAGTPFAAPAGLGDYSDYGRTTIVESIKYVSGDLAAGLYAWQFLYGNSDVDMGLKIRPYVYYTVGINTIKLEVTYNNDEYDIDKWGQELLGGEEDYSTLTVAPKLVTKFNDKFSIESGYEFVSMTDMKARIIPSGTIDDVANKQKLFVNFLYSF